MFSSVKDRFWATVISCGFLLIYLNTLAVHHSEAEDVLSYAGAVALGDPAQLFHPNHLLFENASWLFLEVCRWLNPDISVLIAMQLLQVLSGIATLLIIYSLLREADVSTVSAALAITAIGFCYGFWAYSVEGDTYIIPLPFLFLALRELVLLDKKGWPYSSFIKIALYLTLATLLYQQYVLVVPAVLITIITVWWLRREYNFADIIARCLVLGGLSGSLTLGVYLAVAFLAEGAGSVQEAIAWTLGHGGKGLFHPVDITSIPKAVVGFYKAVWGTNFLFGFDEFNHLAATLFPGLGGHEERYLANGMPIYRLWLCLVMLVTSSLAFLGVLGLAVAESIKQGRRFYRQPVVIAVLSALVLLSIFNTIFYPENLEFWIGLVPLLLILIFLATNSLWSRDKLARYLVLIFIGGLAVGNGLGSVVPQSTERGDFWRDINRYLIEQGDAGDLVLVRCGYVCNNYLGHYSRAEIVPIYSLPVEALLERVDKHHGRVLISSFVFEPLPGYQPTGKYLSAKQQAAVVARLKEEYGVKALLDDRLNHQIYLLGKH